MSCYLLISGLSLPIRIIHRTRFTSRYLTYSNFCITVLYNLNCLASMLPAHLCYAKTAGTLKDSFWTPKFGEFQGPSKLKSDVNPPLGIAKLLEILFNNSLITLYIKVPGKLLTYLETPCFSVIVAKTCHYQQLNFCMILLL